MAAQFVLFLFIQIEKPYKLIEINFNSFFKRFLYKNTYIYNLVNYFLRHIYSCFTINAGINNIILFLIIIYQYILSFMQYT